MHFGFQPYAGARGAKRNIQIKEIMHFGLYLVIGATVLMTFELGYAVYQIACMCL
jgi:hypothetical protein